MRSGVLASAWRRRQFRCCCFLSDSIGEIGLIRLPSPHLGSLNGCSLSLARYAHSKFSAPSKRQKALQLNQVHCSGEKSSDPLDSGCCCCCVLVLLVDSLVSVHRGLVLGLPAARCSSSRAGAVDVPHGLSSGSSISVNLPPCRSGRGRRNWFSGTTSCSLSWSSHVDNLRAVHHTRCRLVVVRSCPDVEPRLFPLLTDLFAKPIVSASLLMPEDDDARGGAGGDGDGSFSDAMQWLDEQPERSVVYVALGSEAPVTADQVHELALGLELSGVRFLWAVRRPAGHSGELLPGGFEARVAGRGVVRAGWVPQVRVLAHAAVGAFLTHCGWGSTVESLFRFGLPLVMLPFIADQGLIARAMAARRVGVEVPRDDADGSFRRDDVAAAVRRVMADGEGEGEAFARNAREMQKVAVDRAKQEQYVDELVGYSQRYK